MKDDKSLILRGTIISIGLGFFIIMILSLSGQNTFIQETIPTASGSTTAIVKTCNPLIPLPINPLSGALCGTLSSNVFSSSTTNPAPVTVKTPVTITPQQNQTVKLSSQTNSVNVTPTNGQPITIKSQSGSTITAVTSNGQQITASTITVSSGVTLTSTNDVVITTVTPQPIVVTPQNGGSVTLTTNSTSSPDQLSIISSCTNGGVPINGVCPTSSTIIPPPICSIQQIANGYTVSGNACVPPPPVCSAIQIANGYTVSGNTCVPPVTEPITITPIVFLIDNNGNNQSLSTNPIPVSLQSFIAVHGVNQNIDHGKLTFGLKLKAKPNTFYQSNGTLKVYINSNSVHPQGIFWSINGITDNNGEEVANLQIPNGIAKTYVMNIADRASLINMQANSINFTLSNVMAQDVKNGMSFHSNSEQSAYGLTLDYDGTMIIKQNSQGQSIRGYPDDNTFVLVSQPQYIAGGQVCSFSGGRQHCGYIQDQVIMGPSCITCNTNIYLENQGPEKLVGTTTMLFLGPPNNYALNSPSTINNIPWDSDVKVVLSGGDNYGVSSYNKVFHTPKSHADYYYRCVGTLQCGTNLP